VATLFLDGGLAGSQLPGDLLVEQTGDGTGQNISLARSQQVIPATKLGELQPLRARDAITIDRVANRVEQVLLAASWLKNKTPEMLFYLGGLSVVAGARNLRSVHLQSVVISIA
jgi:hypothetical protein